MSIIKDRRIGRFAISVDILNESPASCRSLFGKVIVLKTEMQVHNGIIEYWAVCDAFAEIPEGGSVPLYIPEFTTQYDESGKMTSVELIRWNR